MTERDIARDDGLLDALARGESVSGEHEVNVMLAAWRDDVRRGDACGRAADRPVPCPHEVAGRAGQPPIVGSGERVPAVGRFRPRGLPPVTRLVVGAAAAVAVLAGLAVAAGRAGPDSPLWPITRLVYHDRADSRSAVAAVERTIGQAREAMAEGRYADAGRLLDEASALSLRVRDRQQADRLRAQVAEVRRLLEQAVLESNDVAPSPPADRSSGSPVAPGQTPVPGTASPAGGGGLPVPVPTLPGLPLPTATLPSLPLPSPPIGVG
jgi:hypothetical protein